MTLVEFRLGLEKFVDLDDPRSRPFVCDGDPRKCSIFIVGVNPAMQLQEPFSHYWCNRRGFAKSDYLGDFKRQRGGRYTKTRERIEQLADCSGSDITLDTNIFWYPTARRRDLSREQKVTMGFEHLLREVQPKVVFTHGNDAFHFFKRYFSDVAKGDMSFRPRSLGGTTFRLASARHLCLTGVEEAREIGRTLRNVLRSR